MLGQIGDLPANGSQYPKSWNPGIKLACAEVYGLLVEGIRQQPVYTEATVASLHRFRIFNIILSIQYYINIF